MTTHDTAELSLRATITAVGMPTGATPLAGVSGVYQVDWHASKPRFGADELPQLAERPVVVSRSLCAPNRRPLADIRQVG
jgi:hypothetical protein